MLRVSPFAAPHALGRRLTSSLIGLALCSIAQPAASRTLEANPLTLPSILLLARGGDVLTLAPGNYSGFRLTGRQYSPAIEIDASQATLGPIELKNVSGVRFRGGAYRLNPPTTHPRTGKPVFGSAIRIDNSRDVTVHGVTARGPGNSSIEANSNYGDGYGVFVVAGREINIEGALFDGFKTGVALSKTQDFRIVNNRFTAMRSDGIQIGESRNGLIEDNICGETRIRDDEHPDCIQLWSRPTSPPTADITIRRNRATGKMQGVFLGNHVRKGVDDGGYDRIIIEDNTLTLAYPQGIGLYDARASIVRNNTVQTLQGSQWRASINVRGDVLRCGNKVAAGAGKPGINDNSCSAKKY